MHNQTSPQDRRPAWSAEGTDAVQLFRDIYFGKYPAGTKVGEVYEDQSRTYWRYNRDGFYRHYKKLCEKVETYRTFGTGLKEAFRHNLKLNKPPAPEDREPAIKQIVFSDTYRNNDDEEESDDSSFEDDEGDLSVSLQSFESESFLGMARKQAPTQSRVATPTIAAAAAATTPTPKVKKVNLVSQSNEVPLFCPQLIECTGGVLAGYLPIYTGVDYEFSISEDGDKILQKMMIPETFQKAQKIFYRHGLTEYNVYIAGVQESIDKLKPQATTNENGKFFHESVLFHLPYIIEQSFYDEKGVAVNAIFEGKVSGTGLHWVFFYLKKKQVVEIKKQPAKIERELKRETNESQREGRRSSFSKFTGASRLNGNAASTTVPNNQTEAAGTDFLGMLRELKHKEHLKELQIQQDKQKKLEEAIQIEMQALDQQKQQQALKDRELYDAMSKVNAEAARLVAERQQHEQTLKLQSIESRNLLQKQFDEELLQRKNALDAQYSADAELLRVLFEERFKQQIVATEQEMLQQLQMNLKGSSMNNDEEDELISVLNMIGGKSGGKKQVDDMDDVEFDELDDQSIFQEKNGFHPPPMSSID
jgi:hypothetical protein